MMKIDFSRIILEDMTLCGVALREFNRISSKLMKNRYIVFYKNF